MAETGRTATLEVFLGKLSECPSEYSDQNEPLGASLYKQCFTVKGYKRHPNVPKEWGDEADIPTDQWLPAFTGVGEFFGETMVSRLKHNNWCTDSLQKKTLLPLGRSLVARHQKSFSWFTDLPILLQAYVFKFPYRWDDGKKWFGKSSESSCDYLNWLMALIYVQRDGHTWASKKALSVISPETAWLKVLDYYYEEPNAGWVLLLYREAICKLWGRAPEP